MHRVSHTSQKLLIINPNDFVGLQLKDIFNQEFPKPGLIYLTETDPAVPGMTPHHHFCSLPAGDLMRFRGLTVLALPNIKKSLPFLKPPIDILLLPQTSFDLGSRTHLEGVLNYWSPALVIVDKPVKIPSYIQGVFIVYLDSATYFVIERPETSQGLILTAKNLSQASHSLKFPVQQPSTPDLGQLIEYDFKRRKRLSAAVSSTQQTESEPPSA